MTSWNMTTGLGVGAAKGGAFGRERDRWLTSLQASLAEAAPHGSETTGDRSTPTQSERCSWFLHVLSRVFFFPASSVRD